MKLEMKSKILWIVKAGFISYLDKESLRLIKYQNLIIGLNMKIRSLAMSRIQLRSKI